MSDISLQSIYSFFSGLSLWGTWGTGGAGLLGCSNANGNSSNTSEADKPITLTDQDFFAIINDLKLNSNITVDKCNMAGIALSGTGDNEKITEAVARRVFEAYYIGDKSQVWRGLTQDEKDAAVSALAKTIGAKHPGQSLHDLLTWYQGLSYRSYCMTYDASWTGTSGMIPTSITLKITPADLEAAISGIKVPAEITEVTPDELFELEEETLTIRGNGLPAEPEKEDFEIEDVNILEVVSASSEEIKIKVRVPNMSLEGIEEGKRDLVAKKEDEEVAKKEEAVKLKRRPKKQKRAEEKPAEKKPEPPKAAPAPKVHRPAPTPQPKKLGYCDKPENQSKPECNF